MSDYLSKIFTGNVIGAIICIFMMIVFLISYLFFQGWIISYIEKKHKSDFSEFKTFVAIFISLKIICFYFFLTSLSLILIGISF